MCIKRRVKVESCLAIGNNEWLRKAWVDEYDKEQFSFN